MASGLPLTAPERTGTVQRIRSKAGRPSTRSARGAEVDRLREELGVEEVRWPEALVDAGVRADEVTAFEVLPLVEVAWCDGRVDDEERWFIIETAVSLGLELGRSGHARLEAWLDRAPAPELFALWHDFAAQEYAVAPDRYRGLRARLCDGARAVALATGGLLGFGRISRAERSVLQHIDASLGADARH